MSDDPGWHGDITYIMFTCNHAPHFKGNLFIDPLKTFSGTQENTTECLLLHVIVNITIGIYYLLLTEKVCLQ